MEDRAYSRHVTPTQPAENTKNYRLEIFPGNYEGRKEHLLFADMFADAGGGVDPLSANVGKKYAFIYNAVILL